MNYIKLDLLMEYFHAFKRASRYKDLPKEVWTDKIFPYIGIKDLSKILPIADDSTDAYMLYLAGVTCNDYYESRTILEAHEYLTEYKLLSKLYNTKVPNYFLPRIESVPTAGYTSLLSTNDYKKTVTQFLNHVALEYLDNYKNITDSPFIGGSVELQIISKIWDCTVTLRVLNNKMEQYAYHKFNSNNKSNSTKISLFLLRSLDKNNSITYLTEPNCKHLDIFTDVFTAFSNAYNLACPGANLLSEEVKKHVEKFLYKNSLSVRNKKYTLSFDDFARFNFKEDIVARIFGAYIFTSRSDYGDNYEELLFTLIPQNNAKLKLLHLKHRYSHISNIALDSASKLISAWNIHKYVIEHSTDIIRSMRGVETYPGCSTVVMKLYMQYMPLYLINLFIGAGITYGYYSVANNPKKELGSFIGLGIANIINICFIFILYSAYVKYRNKVFTEVMRFFPDRSEFLLEEDKKFVTSLFDRYGRNSGYENNCNLFSFLGLLVILWLPMSAFVSSIIGANANLGILLVEYVVMSKLFLDIRPAYKEKRIATILISYLHWYKDNTNVSGCSFTENLEVYGVNEKMCEILRRFSTEGSLAYGTKQILVESEKYLRYLLDNPDFRTKITQSTLIALEDAYNKIKLIDKHKISNISEEITQLHDDTEALILKLSDRERRINSYLDNNSSSAIRHDSLSECLRNISTTLMFTRNIKEPPSNAPLSEQQRNLVMNMV